MGQVRRSCGRSCAFFGDLGRNCLRRGRNFRTDRSRTIVERRRLVERSLAPALPVGQNAEYGPRSRALRRWTTDRWEVVCPRSVGCTRARFHCRGRPRVDVVCRELIRSGSGRGVGSDSRRSAVWPFLQYSILLLPHRSPGGPGDAGPPGPTEHVDWYRDDRRNGHLVVQRMAGFPGPGIWRLTANSPPRSGTRVSHPCHRPSTRPGPPRSSRPPAATDSSAPQ